MKDAAIVAAGPVVAGACLGLGQGGVLANAARIPVVFVVVAAVMLPALYIGAALLGIAPSIRRVLAAAAGAFRSASLLFLGTAPAVAFLVTTREADARLWFLGQGVVLVGAALALRELYVRAFESCDAHLKAVPLYAAWALVSLGIGAHLYVTQVVV